MILTSPLWAFPLGFLAGYGVYCAIMKLIKFIDNKIDKKSGKINFKVAYDIEKPVQNALDDIITRQGVTGTSNGIAGKVVNIGGNPVIVLSIVIINIDSYSSTFDLIYYRNGKIGKYRVDNKNRLEDAEKYFREAPIRSREIRRDVRAFCNSACILDCQDCILHKYGKPKGVAKPANSKRLPKL